MTDGPVIVTYRDAFFDLDEPDTEREDYLVMVVGWIIDDGLKFLRIGSERLPDGDGYRAITRVPRQCVVSLRSLQVGQSQLKVVDVAREEPNALSLGGDVTDRVGRALV